MPKVKGPLLSLQARGSVGGLLTFQQRRSGAVVYPLTVPRDVANDAQLAQRALMGQAAQAWGDLSVSQQAVYDARAQGRCMSGFNLFVSETMTAPPVVSWWLSGGIDAANCVAAYRAKGAASKVAALQNLVNPGTHDLVDADMNTFDSGIGVVVASAYLAMRYNLVNGAGFLICFSGAVPNNHILCGFGGGNGLAVWNYNDGHVYYDYGNEHGVAPAMTGSGTLGISGTKGYRNGAVDTTGLNGTFSFPAWFFINSVITLVALAIYSATISEAQMQAVSNATVAF